MTGKAESKRYCVIFQLGKDSGIGRVAMCAPGLIALVERWSKKDMEMLCRSNDGQLFGFLFATDKPLNMMRSEFEGSVSTDNSDTMVIYEIGADVAKVGFTRAAHWIERG